MELVPYMIKVNLKYSSAILAVMIAYRSYQIVPVVVEGSDDPKLTAMDPYQAIAILRSTAATCCLGKYYSV